MRPSTLAKTAGAAFAAAAVGGLATKPAVESAWYRRLNKSGFQPPSLAFPDRVEPALQRHRCGVGVDHRHAERAR